MTKVHAFISYSHRDRKMHASFETHLALLRRQKRLTAWSDRLIEAGEIVDDVISAELLRSRLVFLLVSPDFIASDYCYGVELSAALAGHKTGHKHVIPIIVDHCDWKSAPFAKLKALPTDGKPIRAFRPQSRGWADVVEGIRQALDGLDSAKASKTRRRSSDQRQPVRPTATKQSSAAVRQRKRTAVDWLHLVDARQAWRNCRVDHYRDWYRDPWDWPEWEWLVKRDPTYLIQALDSPSIVGAAGLDVAKEDWRVRPAVILQPADRLIFQALADALSQRAIGRMRDWVYGVRLSVHEPRSGRYLRGDQQAKMYRRRLNTLASRYHAALRTDIADFFASIDIDRLGRQLHARAKQSERAVADALIELLYQGERQRETKGLPQRYLASSMLANLYLAPLDDVLDLYSGDRRGRFHLPRSVRWVDDIWVFARELTLVEEAKQAVHEAIAALSLTAAKGKTAILEGDALVGAAANFELSAIDGELAGSDGSSSPSLDALMESILSNPASSPRTHIVFATTRMRANQRFERISEFRERCHLMPHGADALGRLFRDGGAYRDAHWYVEFAKRFMGASDWAVAQLGAMFPAEESPGTEIVDLFQNEFLNADSVALAGLSAQRLAAWKGRAAREAIRACGRRSESGHIRRIVALTDVGFDADQPFITEVLGELAECRPTLEMLRDRSHAPLRINRDFKGVLATPARS